METTTQQKTKTLVLSETFLLAVARFGSVSLAFDHVFGPGSYVKFAGELYDELRAK